MHPLPGAYAPGLTKMPRLRRWCNVVIAFASPGVSETTASRLGMTFSWVRQTCPARPAFLLAHIPKFLALLDFGTVGSFDT